MPPDAPPLIMRLACDARDLRAAQRLRYRVFVRELGADGALVDHDAGLEQDEFDPHCDHLLLIDPRRDPAGLDDVVGAYRLLPDDRAADLGRFYSEAEYDLGALRASGRRLLELGRSCVDQEYRGGGALYQLWNGLAEYVLARDIDVMFGTASFHGTDPGPIAHALAHLHHAHLAPPELCARARLDGFQPMDLMPAQAVDRRAANQAIPPLIKSYLRLGGCVGDGAYIDRAFNTIDVCLIMDTARLSARHVDLYTRGVAGVSEAL